jgi:hypothetical protein
MQRTWTKTGASIVRDFTLARVAALLDQMNGTLEPIPDSMPMMPGLGIQQLIRELRIPKVDRVTFDGMLDRPGEYYAVYGIEGHYTNGRAVVWAVDRGSDIVPIASDFYPKPATLPPVAGSTEQEAIL